MLSITIAQRGFIDVSSEWYVNTQVSSDILRAAHLNPGAIEIRADRGELEFIRDNFTNIPYALHRYVQVWRGEFARFILDNL
jgi:hypothetical protein